MNFMRTRLRFALLRSSLVAIIGMRGKTNFRLQELEDIPFNLIPRLTEYETLILKLNYPF